MFNGKWKNVEKVKKTLNKIFAFLFHLLNDHEKIFEYNNIAANFQLCTEAWTGKELACVYCVYSFFIFYIRFSFFCGIINKYVYLFGVRILKGRNSRKCLKKQFWGKRMQIESNVFFIFFSLVVQKIDEKCYSNPLLFYWKLRLALNQS